MFQDGQYPKAGCLEENCTWTFIVPPEILEEFMEANKYEEAVLVETDPHRPAEIPSPTILVENGIQNLRGALSAMMHPESKDQLDFGLARNLLEVLERLNQDAAVPDDYRIEDFVMHNPRQRRRMLGRGMPIGGQLEALGDDQGVVMGIINKAMKSLEDNSKNMNPASKEAERLIRHSKRKEFSPEMREKLVKKAESILTKDLEETYDADLDTIVPWGCEPGEVPEGGGMLPQDYGPDGAREGQPAQGPEEVRRGEGEEAH